MKLPTCTSILAGGAIRSFEIEGEWRRAVHLLGELRDDGGPPDAGCYSEAMAAYSRPRGKRVGVCL